MQRYDSGLSLGSSRASESDFVSYEEANFQHEKYAPRIEAYPPGPFNAKKMLVLESSKNTDFSRNWKGVDPARRRVLGQRRHRQSAWGAAEKRKREKKLRVNLPSVSEDATLESDEGFELILPGHYNLTEPEELDYGCAAEGFIFCEVHEEPNYEFNEVPAEFTTEMTEVGTVSEIINERIPYQNCKTVTELKTLCRDGLNHFEKIVNNTGDLKLHDIQIPDLTDDILDFKIMRSKRHMDNTNQKTIPEKKNIPDTDQKIIPEKMTIPDKHQSTRRFTGDEIEYILDKEPIQKGSVIFSPIGIGAEHIDEKLNVVHVKQLPPRYRNNKILRGLANRGFLSITHRLRDCDRNTIYVVPFRKRYIATMLTMTLQQHRTICMQYDLIKKVFARKFCLRNNQTIDDFLKFKMTRYKSAMPADD